MLILAVGTRDHFSAEDIIPDSSGFPAMTQTKPRRQYILEFGREYTMFPFTVSHVLDPP